MLLAAECAADAACGERSTKLAAVCATAAVAVLPAMRATNCAHCKGCTE